jgi:hypothetical protein
VVEGLEVVSVVELEGVGTARLQHRFHHEILVWFSSVRLIDGDLYLCSSSFIFESTPNQEDHLCLDLDYNGRNTRSIRYNPNI